MSGKIAIKYGVFLALLALGTVAIFVVRELNGWNHFDSRLRTVLDKFHSEAVASETDSVDTTPDSSTTTEDKGLSNDDGWGVELGSAVLDAPEPEFTAEKVEEFQAKGDWCVGHNVPESMCTVCNPDLIHKFKESGDWCGGHGVPESLCKLCNRALSEKEIGLDPVSEAAPQSGGFDPGKADEYKASGDWCAGHKVPESMCTVCNPNLIPKFKASGDWCGGHGVPESLCTLCNSNLAQAGLGLSPSGDSGHETGDLTAESIANSKATGDWCVEHSIPESLCTICNPALIPKYKDNGDWCREHDVPESLCPLCNPAIAALGIGKDWCEKHNLPESQCVYCNPEIGLSKSVPGPHSNEGLEIAPWSDAISNSLEINLLQNLPVSVEPIYDPDQRLGINPNCRLHGTQILLASPEVAGEVGIAVESVKTNPVTESLSCYGEVQFNRSRFVWLSSRAPGIVESVQGDLGDFVKKGQVVATVDSAELGEAKAALLRAHAEHDRWKWVNESYESSNGSGAISRKDLVEARAALAQASIEIDIAAQKLRNFGLDEEALVRIVEDHDTSTVLPVTAPFDSTVVELEAVPGEVIERGGPIFALADTSTLWAMLDVFVRDLPKVKKGMPVIFSPDGLDGQVFHGTVDWISSQLDEKTRTAKVRAVLHNHEGQIRSGLFGKGEIAVHENANLLAVPRDAVQWDGCCNIVFVKKSDVLYQPRKIRIGYATDENYVVEAGLFPGERIVTTGSYLLKTEILKGSIGAGCTCGG